MQIDDHVSLSELAQSWIDDKRIIIRDYTVVIDSSGNTIPVIEKMKPKSRTIRLISVTVPRLILITRRRLMIILVVI